MTSPARTTSLGVRRLLGATEHRADPRDELLRTERLRHVVVRADLEAGDLVRLVAASREHHDRHGRVAAERARDIKAVELRQTEIEHDKIGT